MASDVDLLAIVDGHDARFDSGIFSIYSYARIRELWREGNPFAWHLCLESKLLYSHDRSDFLEGLGDPSQYKSYLRDCEKFLNLFREAQRSILSESNSRVFNLSTVFLSIRNFASCFSLGVTKRPDFSRGSSLGLGSKSIPISKDCYSILERARILSTRGHGDNLTSHEVLFVTRELDTIREWMENLIREARNHERIQ